jgi:UDP-N-acetylmuramate--alanine ligase
LVEHVIIAPVYAAGEQPIEGAGADDLVAGIKACGHHSVALMETPEALAGVVEARAKPGDFGTCLGAGTIK